jgi:hypothetical protein
LVYLSFLLEIAASDDDDDNAKIMRTTTNHKQRRPFEFSLENNPSELKTA